MLGLDMMDVVPAGTIQDMVRLHAPDLLKVLMHYGRKHYDVGPDERLSIQLIETTLKGRETVVALPLVVDAATLQTRRKLPYYDLMSLVANAPIAEWINTGKQVKKATDKLDPIMRKLNAARDAGDAKGVAKYEAELKKLVAQLPQAVRRMMGLEAEPEQAAEAPNELPAPAATPAGLPAPNAPAAESGDNHTTHE